MAGSHSPSTHIPSPPKETRKYIGKYSLYWSSETTNQKYNFAFKNLLSQAEDTTIDNTHPVPIPFKKSLGLVSAGKPTEADCAPPREAGSAACAGAPSVCPLPPHALSHVLLCEVEGSRAARRAGPALSCSVLPSDSWPQCSGGLFLSPLCPLT